MSCTLLTPDEVSKILRVSKRSLYELLRRDTEKLPVIRIGRAVRFRSVDVEEFIASKAKGSIQ